MSIIPPEEIPQENWTDQHKSLVKTLETLVGDLNTQGWDQPGRIYFLDEPTEDPQVALAGIIPTHPVADLQAAYNEGFRVPPETLGLVVSHEGYRHLTAEEVWERNPEMFERLKAYLVERGHDLTDVPVEQIKGYVKDHYYNTILPQLSAPGAMPDHMRAEIRVVNAMLRDGTCILVGQSRGKDDLRVNVLKPGQFVRQGVPTALYLFIHNLFPDSENKDPMQAVADYEALKEMEEFGESES
jgi:hypothetical protein